jgi:hypothetical protein
LATGNVEQKKGIPELDTTYAQRAFLGTCAFILKKRHLCFFLKKKDFSGCIVACQTSIYSDLIFKRNGSGSGDPIQPLLSSLALLLPLHSTLANI